MTSDLDFAGVLAPVLTPFRADLSPDADRLVAHCRWLLEDEGASGLVLFGTTGEANSLSAGEREELLAHVVAGGLPAERLMAGTGCCALSDTVRLTRHALAHGVRRVLLLPPFYYKAVDDEGLYRAVAETIERVGDPALRVYLYHIPPVAQVGYAPALVERLRAAYPEVIVGLKDSSGDWSNTAALLERFEGEGFAVFPGSEVFLLDGLRAGAAGCITATGNVNMAAIRRAFDGWQGPEADALQAEITALRKTVQAYPMIPALKAILARHLGDPGWATVRPPFAELAAERAEALMADLADRGFPLAA